MGAFNGYVAPSLPLAGSEQIVLAQYNSTTGAWDTKTVAASDLATAPTAPVLVADLPTSPPEGTRSSVKDASSPTFLSVVVGGGTSFSPVIFSGNDWLCG